MSIDMEQFHQVFFDESEEHLETMEQLLMAIDPDEPDPESLNSIFRAAHSIKGGSGIFGFSGLGGLTHVMENLLDKARSGQQTLSNEIVSQLLQTVDVLKLTLDAYREGADIDQPTIDLAIEQLEQTIDNHTEESKSEDELGFGFFETIDKNTNEDDGFGFFDDPPATESSDDDDGFGFFDTSEPEVTVETKSAIKANTAPESPKPVAASGKKVIPAHQKSASAETKSIRVDTNKIDSLVNLIGELVITQSMLAELGKGNNELSKDKLEQGLAELERNTRELQEATMSMRMLPVSFVFNRFPRLVRDLASQLNKSIDLKIEGGGTEIDKGLVEKLVDPLTHLVRNSIDHGIESPDIRKAKGKPENGTITLVAAQRGGNIVISVQDDGGGLNKEKILEKARQNGLDLPDINNEEAIWNLIFAAGFSTADEVTDISGRGVGMDVVRRNIENIGGRISIESSSNGSSFNISVPLTLAIVDGMCVKSGDQVFVVPLVNIIESMQPVKSQLRLITNDQLLWVRDKYWPILDLAKQMDIPDTIDDPTKSIIILIESSKKRFGLKVDSLLGQQQVVIKSLEQHFKRVPGASGATIMGDGHVALILDVESLSDKVNSKIAEDFSNERMLDERRAS